MFTVFLPALNFRGDRSPYLWWFYKFLGEFGDQAAYICGEEYFLDTDQLSARGRPEVSPESGKSGLYRIPARATLEQQLRVDIPLEEWVALEDLFPFNPIAAFRHYCVEEDSRLCAAIERALDRLGILGVDTEAVITCVNCASLLRVCQRRNLPLIHLELGPLRQPNFLRTAYFDFSGVNGRTESQRRFATARSGSALRDDWCDVGRLRALFAFPRIDAGIAPRVDLGLGLQVEDDSNAICYANGFTTHALISNARRELANGHVSPTVLVRPHPASPFDLRSPPAGLEVDHSASSLEFILQCKRIATVNSGIAVEAALLERSVRVHGESPFGFCIDPDSGDCGAEAISFFLLNYLVPWDLVFRPEYLRWRLSNPSEVDIRQRHLEFFMKDRIRILEARIADLEQALAERDQQLARIRASLAWRLAAPLWQIWQSALRTLGLARG